MRSLVCSLLSQLTFLTPLSLYNRWFIIGVVGAVVGRVKDMEIPFLSERLRRSSRGGYRHIHLDHDDAQLLQDYDDEE